MKSTFHLSACALAALVVGCMSCHSGENSSEAAKDSNNVKIDSPTAQSQVVPASVSKADADFAVDAATGGMMEVRLGEIADQKATAQDVKDFGSMMIRDHTKGDDKLKSIATSKNLTLPDSLPSKMQTEIADLQNKSGKSFDKAYIAMMVDDHKKDIKAFEDEAKNGSDADIRGFADSSLHMLHEHLDAAEKCHRMEKSM